jgi:tetratricopeptide (TPR) repeat protein
VVLFAVLAVALVLAGWLASRWLGARSSSSSERAPSPSSTPVRRAPLRPGGGPASPESPAATPTPAAAASLPSDQLDEAWLLTLAQTKLSEGKEAEAVVLLERARQLDPTNLDLLDRLEKTRKALRSRQTAEERLAEAKARYAAGDYGEALRLLYRVPQPYQPAELNQWIANGWYNMGVQRLQTGDLREAIEYFGNCLELQPRDEAARRGQEVARRYRTAPADDAFRIFAQNARLRDLDERP